MLRSTVVHKELTLPWQEQNSIKNTRAPELDKHVMDSVHTESWQENHRIKYENGIQNVSSYLTTHFKSVILPLDSLLWSDNSIHIYTDAQCMKARKRS